MLPLALTPYLIIGVVSGFVPDVKTALGSARFQSPLPITFIAATVGIYATHVIYSVRREAFKAKQLGQYRLGEELGSGGMGVVYQAEHMLLKRPCAIKLIRAESEADQQAIANFEKEVKATAKLTHWNTVEIFDYGHSDDGTFYYVMELLPGLSLEELIEKHGPLEPARVIYLLRQICDALDEAHHVGLIHRDLKPANIFVSQRGRRFDVAKLLDFGLVRDRESKAESSGLFSGTPLYMSPEQATDYHEVDPRSDIYSLGCVAFHALTGEPPFAGNNFVEVIAKHAHQDAPAPSQVRSDIPKDVDTWVTTCLCKDADGRFSDVKALANALDRCECAPQWNDARATQWWNREG